MGTTVEPVSVIYDFKNGLRNHGVTVPTTSGATSDIDGAAAVPDVSTLSSGFITLRYVAGVLVVYVNDSGTIKSLALGSPAA